MEGDREKEKTFFIFIFFLYICKIKITTQNATQLIDIHIVGDWDVAVLPQQQVFGDAHRLGGRVGVCAVLYRDCRLS
jgi:hypothetical protein